jgi:hypothetical protein
MLIALAVTGAGDRNQAEGTTPLQIGGPGLYLPGCHKKDLWWLSVSAGAERLERLHRATPWRLAGGKAHSPQLRHRRRAGAPRAPQTKH